MTKINKLLFNLLPYIFYSSDLTPSDYFHFSNLKIWLDGQRFAKSEEVESALNGYFEELNGSRYKQGIKAIEYRWEKCIELKGDYHGE